MMYDEDKQEPITEPDTDNRTKFNPQEVPNQYRGDSHETTREHYKRLSGLNTGLWNGKWQNKEKMHRSDNLARFDAISSSMELTDYQKRRARTLFDEFPLGTFGHDVDTVAFAICVIVAEQDGRMFDPTEKVASVDDLSNVQSDELFHNVALEVGLHYGKLETVINKIRDRGYKWNWW